MGSYRKEQVNGQWEEWVEWKPDVDPTVTMSFPPLLERDVESSVKAIATGATLGGFQKQNVIPEREVSRMILTALGADDVDQMLEELYPEGTSPAEAALTEAAREFVDGLEELIEKYAK